MEMLFPVWNVCFIILLGCLRYNKFPYFGMIRTFALILYTLFFMLIFALGVRVSMDGTDKPVGKMAYYDDCYNCCNSTYTVYFIKSNGWN